jgi:hypothetical protein
MSASRVRRPSAAAALPIVIWLRVKVTPRVFTRAGRSKKLCNLVRPNRLRAVDFAVSGFDSFRAQSIKSCGSGLNIAETNGSSGRTWPYTRGGNR